MYQKIARMLKQYIPSNEREIAIFPYGYHGQMIHHMLKDLYGINDVILIDNGLAEINPERFHKSKDILPRGGDMLVIISSFTEMIYTEIRNEVCKYVPLENICDIFSQSAYFDSGMYGQHAYNSYGEPMLNDKTRVDHLVCAANEVYRNQVDGAIAGLGVFLGAFSRYINTCFPDRKMYLFDTFSGFDARDTAANSKDSVEPEEKLSMSDRKRVNAMYHMNGQMEVALKNLSYNTQVEVRKGYFPETTKGLSDEKFAFVSIDVDYYKPIMAGLEYFYPRLSAGGYLFCHDYQYKGAIAAVQDFCKKNEVAYVPLSDGVSVVMQKPIS